MTDSNDLGTRERCLRIALGAVNMAAQRGEHYAEMQALTQESCK